MLHKNGDFIFRASAISNSLRVAESGRNSASFNRCAIDLSSSVPWHGVDQFLASKIYPAGFKQPDWRYSSRPILSFQQWADVPRRIRNWPQVILMRLIVRCTLHPDNRLVGRGDLATGYRCLSAG